ncbi:hypothetical protein [Endozoicomonas sp.]|uniref:ApeI family dehydratase n=1 Tax=Endozoicomonas sp. TaxID=1892382 RepID=UPI0028855436|nr:hypothetical protein [Endozoicomonas sp.]
MKTMDEAIIRSVDRRENGLTIRLYIPDELHWFRGHFPDRPVLPGVVQTHWAIGYGVRYLNLPDRIRKLEVIKFKNLIRPDMEITLQLDIKANGKLTFSYRHNSDEMSSGRVVY